MAKKHKVSSEMVVAVSAVLVGVCALAVSLYETSLMRTEQRAAVMPILELSRSINLNRDNPEDPSTRLNLQVENVGIGPARVKDFRVTVDGETMLTWSDMLEAMLGREADVSFGQSTINGRTITPQRRDTIFELNSKSYALELNAAFSRLDFEACYCSIFDECWTTSYRSFGISEPVEQCETSDASFQQ